MCSSDLPDAVAALTRELVSRATVVTPNLPEAERLTGMSVTTVDHMRAAAQALRERGPKAVLVKGGHLEGDQITDVLASEDGVRLFHSTRIDTRHTHGTGCTLASAIATGLAQELSLVEAVSRARDYVLAAIRAAPGLGHGHGPLNHAHTLAPEGYQ